MTYEFSRFLFFAVSSLKLDGENVPYQEIADEIGKIAGVKTLGLFLDVTKAAVAPRGSEAKIIEKVLSCFRQFQSKLCQQNNSISHLEL